MPWLLGHFQVPIRIIPIEGDLLLLEDIGLGRLVRWPWVLFLFFLQGWFRRAELATRVIERVKVALAKFVIFHQVLERYYFWTSFSFLFFLVNHSLKLRINVVLHLLLLNLLILLKYLFLDIRLQSNSLNDRVSNSMLYLSSIPCFFSPNNLLFWEILFFLGCRVRPVFGAAALF